MNVRRVAVVTVVLVLVAGGVLIGFVLLGSNTTTALDEGEAQGDGVFVYDTTGWESVDALTGARHDYPPITYLTVSPGGCGELQRWQALQERWSEWEVCDPVAVTLAGVESYHYWFGVEDVQQYRCDPPAPYLPPGPDVTTWTFVCSTGERSEETTVEVVETEQVDVGGEAVETIHLRYTSSLSGGSTGGSTTDRWFRAADGLLVQETGTTNSTTSSAIGTVRYTEEYTITLRSLQPSSG